jgi:purine-binding chemotaxis protein CheW
VERLVEAGAGIAEAATALDPEQLVAAGMAAPSLADDIRYPLGDANDVVASPAAVRAAAAYFVVEAAGGTIRLARETVLEFVEPPPCVPVPGAPAGFLGVGILRGDALPVMSLAALLGLPDVAPGGFVVIALAGGRRLLLGVDRVIGLRTGEDGPLFDPATAIPEALRRIVFGFPSTASGNRQAEPAKRDGGQQYLSFTIAKQKYALPVEAVDRVVPSQNLVALPRYGGEADAVAGAIELRGQVVPVARLEIAPDNDHAPACYVIVRGEAGPMAIGVDAVERLMALLPEQIAPMRGGQRFIESVAVLDDEGDLLRILAADRIGGSA